MTRILILTFILVCTLGRAEDFQGKANIDAVSQTGFYKIILSPEIISATQSDYSDIRIFNKMYQEIPYIFVENQDSIYTLIPGPVIKQTDSVSLKKSFITLRFNKPYEISKIELSLKGPELYLRNCSVGTFVKKGNKMKFNHILQFQLSSGTRPIVTFEKIKATELIIIIDNADNPPLHIYSANVFQHTKYLVANLKSDERYELFFGNKTLKAPDYDLKYFSDSISKNIKIIGSTIKQTLTLQKNSSPPLFFTKTFLWIATGIILGVLTWLSIRLTHEIRKK